MQTRRFGRTDLNVSVIGFGGTWISELGIDEAVRVVRRAFDLGINYFDTAKLDGDSEEKIGSALSDIREKCIIATKTGSRTRGEAYADIKCSLRRLRTDRLDIIQLHGIDDDKTLKKALGPGGSLEGCKKARSEGIVDYIGVTGHKPLVLAEAIKTNEFDAVLVPINVVTRQALEELVPLAKRLNVGVAAMKPLSAKTSNLITCLYKPSLSLLSDELDLNEWLGESIATRVERALHFILAQDVATAVVGFRSVGEVEAAAKVGDEYCGLTDLEKKLFSVSLDGHCRDCGLCLPCPRNINIPAVLRFYALYDAYGLKNWARRLYGGLEVKADECHRCGDCEQRCPYKLPIIEMLEKARFKLSNCY
ncbi:MAG: aldo/keto reductase [Candidatus Bathyarchaeota archaeon]|nr:aldo/keto reductase [Candidatus Bathyarchaeota archaeon]MCX8177508.1 aldo/keto reductase [Candidatus Bathyarchaeota archaeon]MDW8194175.1 aldo/keto reductase [Nitrososphaerota archaeon]